MKVTILGSGTSHGIPMIGCHCRVCTSDDPRNKRLRTSALLEFDDRQVLIDTAVELRLAALANRVERVDAVLLTHQHTDHIAGFDDLRRFCSLQQSPIPCYGNTETIRRVREVYPYVPPRPGPLGYDIPVIEFNIVAGPFELFGRTVTPVPLEHGRWPCFGYRVGNFAYCTDVHAIPEASLKLLAGLDTLVLGALRHRPHVTHFTVAEALAAIDLLRPRRAYLTHLAHDLDHAETSAALPANVQLAYDGLVFEVAGA